MNKNTHTQHVYNAEFFDYLNETAEHSARQVINVVQPVLKVNSVLDIGCGQGVWLKVWKDNGVETVNGVDGDYVERDKLFIDKEEFTPHDLSTDFSNGKRYDLATSFEVAEHIRKESADIFVDSLTSHSDRVLFSAAVPGQGGETHVNEQPYRYWQEKFEAKGYAMYDCVRPKIVGDESISFWYRYNMFLYVKKEQHGALPQEIQKTRIELGEKIVDYTPFLLKLRKLIIRCVPHFVEQRLAVINHKMVLRKARAQKAKAA